MASLRCITSHIFLWPISTVFSTVCSSNSNWFCFSTARRSPGVMSTDRKSTRLNSSHRCILYVVFCLKKKMVLDEFYLHQTTQKFSVGYKNTTTLMRNNLLGS